MRDVKEWERRLTKLEGNHSSEWDLLPQAVRDAAVEAIFDDEERAIAISAELLGHDDTAFARSIHPQLMEAVRARQ